MNAFAPIRAADLVEWSPAELAHRQSIKVHCPDADEMGMATRVELAAMRDLASAGINRAKSGEAAAMLQSAAAMAATYVYARLPASRLLRVRLAVWMTIETARTVERALRDG